MYQPWAWVGHPTYDTPAALAYTAAEHDRSQVPIILEALRFTRPDASEYAVRTVASLTGGDFTFGLREWRDMGEWLGRNPSECPSPRYPEWKIHVLSQIDPAMAALLQPAVEHSPVNLTEIMWGGVRVDGIPPLENAPYVLAEQATWLWPDDRATRSLWHQFTGEPIVGPLAASGIRQPLFPSVVMTWQEWLAEHPIPRSCPATPVSTNLTSTCPRTTPAQSTTTNAPTMK